MGDSYCNANEYRLVESICIDFKYLKAILHKALIRSGLETAHWSLWQRQWICTVSTLIKVMRISPTIAVTFSQSVSQLNINKYPRAILIFINTKKKEEEEEEKDSLKVTQITVKTVKHFKIFFCAFR